MQGVASLRNRYPAGSLPIKLFACLSAAILILAIKDERPAFAFTLSTGQTRVCHSVNGNVVPEISLPSLSGPFHSGYTGLTQYMPDGTARISWDAPKLASLPSAAHDFIFFHECAHAHVPTSDELEANCVGLIDMRAAGLATPAKEAQIGQFHASLGFMGPRYGMGTDYWQRTVQCANARQATSTVATGTDSTAPSATCMFKSGSLTGQVVDFSSFPGVTPLPIGSACTDGRGSAGVVVPPSAKVGVPQQNSLTTSCHFLSGLKAGQTIDYSGQPNVHPAVPGTACTDGSGSFGVAVDKNAAANPSSPVSTGGLSSKCKFSFGPRSGQVQDYNPLPPIPIGTPCNDGQGSVGQVVP